MNIHRIPGLSPRALEQTLPRAFAAAAHRRLAFEAALRIYRGRHPGMSEPLARRRVAKNLCFAGRAEPQRQIGLINASPGTEPKNAPDLKINSSLPAARRGESIPSGG